jgi:hypothetical protein
MTRILKAGTFWIEIAPKFGLIPVLHNPAIARHIVTLIEWHITDDILDALMKTQVKIIDFTECTWDVTRTHRFDGTLYSATPHILTMIEPTAITTDCTIYTLPPTVRHLDIEHDECLKCPIDQLESLTAFELPTHFRGTVKKPVRFYTQNDDIELDRCIEQYVIPNDDPVMEAMFVLQWLMTLQRIRA